MADVYAEMRATADRILRGLERERTALLVLAETVGDLTTEPDCPPALRAAYITYRETTREATR